MTLNLSLLTAPHNAHRSTHAKNDRRCSTRCHISCRNALQMFSRWTTTPTLSVDSDDDGWPVRENMHMSVNHAYWRHYGKSRKFFWEISLHFYTHSSILTLCIGRNNDVVHLWKDIYFYDTFQLDSIAQYWWKSKNNSPSLRLLLCFPLLTTACSTVRWAIICWLQADDNCLSARCNLKCTSVSNTTTWCYTITLVL